MIFFWILPGLAALLAAFCFFLAAFSLGGKRQTLDEARAWQAAHYDVSWYDRTEKKDYTVSSFDGYVLHVQLLAGPAPSGKYIILSHGYTDNRIGSLKYAKMYLDLGFQVILYDLRGHGENAKDFCTYSVRERKDLAALIADTRARYPDLKQLGLHGESLGAATSLAVLDGKPPVSFVVADCGFSEIGSVMRAGLRHMHLPGFLIHPVSLCAKALCGSFYRDMRPIDSLRQNEIPILFIHGAKDDFIPPAHSLAMAEAAKGFRTVRLVEGAGHAQSILTAPEAYRGFVEAFLAEPAVRSR